MKINGEYFKNEKEYLEHMKKIHKLCEEIIKKEESRGRKMRKCIKCNKEKLEDEFYAKWSHWCNDCIDKRKRDMDYKEFMRNGGIDGKENMMPLKTE